MRAAFLQERAKDSPDELAKAFRASLVDFGYPVSLEYVRECIQHFLEDTPAKGGPEMFVHGWLKNGTDD